MSDDIEARGHHAITHDGETYIKLADASGTFSLYRKDIAAKAARIAELEAALIEINEINAKRSGYNKAIDKIICEALEGGKE